ncbi:hypothetical protein PR202_ga10946 [Eleusine coracana subsp. coracana]|uniref:DUF6598 domain-containing protein n=1 Tax=Eleusine coracana subsp. coracana TaxID=191504 RepID=A0AAV5C820_ELECO|nr:hypothetical protein PR202_ga10946 [Eleusine coracana subsp. coracana]
MMSNREEDEDWVRGLDEPKKPLSRYYARLSALVEENSNRPPPVVKKEEEAVADHERQKRREHLIHVLTIIITIVHANFVITPSFFLTAAPLGPMRDTEAPIHVLHGTVCKEGEKSSLPGDCSANSAGASQGRLVPCNSVNVFSVKIVSSDVGFPINVYGTVIARDSLDLNVSYRNYSFQAPFCICKPPTPPPNICETCSQDESLILTGPKRGLALIDAVYFEVDLKIKGGRKQKDKQLSKGYVALDGVPRSSKDLNEVERYNLDTMLSKVVLMCAVEKRAVEATIAIEVIQGKFSGEITACTSGVRDSILLHDTKMTGDSTGTGVVQLLRRVVAVGLKEKLILTLARTGACIAKSTMKFTPRVNDRDEKEMACGFVKMRVKVAWSIMSRLDLD